MESEFLKHAKKCCSREHDRLVENLSICDKCLKNSAEKHLCYRVAAKISGRFSKKCILDEQLKFLSFTFLIESKYTDLLTLS